MHDSSFGRLLGALVAPGKTFRSIAERPTWLPPLLVLLALGTAAGYMLQQRVDQEEMVRYQMSQFGMEVSEDQMQQAVERAEKQGPVGLIVAPFISAIVFLIVALVFWVAFKLIGSEMDFRSSLATTVHAMLPAAVSLILTILVLLGRSAVTPEEMMGGGILASSAAVFAPDDASRVVKSLLGSLDVFSIWTLLLLVIGYSVVAKVSRKSAAITVVVVWLVYVLGKAGFAAGLGRLAGGAGA